ncbi:MAG: RNA polymerase sigma factor, partial [Lachnospiraceae bacterium]|nr:RNA polymerase sigma factor [Lachnospiraceae bacterium]
MDNGASSYRRYLEGDKEGIAEIVREFKDGLILYLNGYVDNLYTAEDLTEDTFFKLMTRKPRFSGRSSFKTWLYTIGRNIAVDWLRRESKQTVLPAEDMEQ